MKNSFKSDTVAAGCSSPARNILVRQAFRLEGLTIIWMTIEAAVATASGIAAGSLSLLAFGIDSFIELASAVVLGIHLAKAAEISGKGGIFKRRFRRPLSVRKHALLSSAMAEARRPSWPDDRAIWRGHARARLAGPRR